MWLLLIRCITRTTRIDYDQSIGAAELIMVNISNVYVIMNSVQCAQQYVLWATCTFHAALEPMGLELNASDSPSRSFMQIILPVILYDLGRCYFTIRQWEADLCNSFGLYSLRKVCVSVSDVYIYLWIAHLLNTSNAPPEEALRRFFCCCFHKKK
ncbi:hypothetical protein NDU88_002583 [Pleurodeles waltl]|uniref:Uncharacterized protein n=1 Tax=Pleurodeles waltl TaxID=8319 RepID=A0AAV7LGA0_PLEWA|nr:hypothetical protein NDU88_002583 [Pleurodeles waltl]